MRPCSLRIAALVLAAAAGLGGQAGAASPMRQAQPDAGRLPPIPGLGPHLDSISCTAPQSCWAVGDTSRGLFALHLERGRWSYVAMPTPHGYTRSQGPWVSCVSDGDCWAAGGTDYDPIEISPSRNVAIHWNGVRWRLASVPSPGYRDATYDALESISCPTARECWAVGYRNGYQSALRWDGRRWTVSTVPLAHVPAADSADLESVNCVSPRDCWAVGTRTAGSGEGGCGSTGELNEVLHWDGTRWAIFNAPSTSSCTNDLGLVSCVSARSCWATGGTENQNSALHWNGRRWQFEPIPSPGVSDLDLILGLDCPSAGTCWAVGTRGSQTGESVNMILRYRSGRWRVIQPPQPPGRGNELLGVACGGPTSCWAVGYTQQGNFRAQVLHWDGRRWSVAP